MEAKLYVVGRARNSFIIPLVYFCYDAGKFFQAYPVLSRIYCHLTSHTGAFLPTHQQKQQQPQQRRQTLIFLVSTDKSGGRSSWRSPTARPSRKPLASTSSCLSTSTRPFTKTPLTSASKRGRAREVYTPCSTLCRQHTTRAVEKLRLA